MSRGGLIIRLIDVALIILFGFIAISDIKTKAQIKLPADAPESQATLQRHLIRVMIDAGGRFEVDGGDQAERLEDLSALESWLRRQLERDQSKGVEMVVLIEPNEESIIQLTVSVMDLCEKYGIPKNINYASLEL